MDKMPLINMEDIVKIFPPSKVALDSASIKINEGEVHAIIGENGAGKSTLMKVLYALEKPNSGTISIKGNKVNFNSPQDAVAMGIGMVHQEFMLIPGYSIIENIMLGYESVDNFGFIDRNKAKEKFKEVAEVIKFNINPDEKVENLSVAVQQKIEIIKQLYREVNILILDEPTAVLAPQEVQELFTMLNKLKSEGKTIIFISHKLDEILEIADTITVMRQGKHIWTKRNENLTKQDLAEAMVGRSVLFAAHKEQLQKGEVVLELDKVTVSSKTVADRNVLDNVSIKVHQNEIVGIAGVEGNGQYELVQAIMGLADVKAGRILLKGKDITKDSIRKRREQIAYISQDRKVSGSSQKNSLVDNSFMTHHYLNPSMSGKFGLLNLKKINMFTKSIIENFSVACSGANAPITSLSGGNQQKIIVGREFELHNPLLILDQPVRGLDVGSIEYIQQRIVEQREKGTALLLVSADLDELFALSDVIVVMHQGKVAAVKRPEETDKTEIGEYMLGSKEVV